MLIGVELTDTINLGAILILIAAGALTLIFTVRSNIVSIQKETISSLEDRLEEERTKKHAAVSEAAALKLTRDLTPLLESQTELTKRLVDLNERLLAMEEEGEARYGRALSEVRSMFAEHEQRAQERHDAQLVVLAEITKTLEHLPVNQPRDQNERTRKTDR